MASVVVITDDKPLARPELGKAELGFQGPRGANRRRPKGGLHMNNEPNTHLSQEGPQWMKDMFQELSEMFEELFPDADSLNLEEMQQRLDELEQPLVAASEQPSGSGSARLLSRLP